MSKRKKYRMRDKYIKELKLVDNIFNKSNYKK
jgi:hypothetical protein